MNAGSKVWRSGCLLMAMAGASAATAGPPGLQEAAPDHATTAGGQPVLVDVIANDGDVGATRRLVTVLPAGHGRTRVENGRVQYTPDAGFVGSDQFQYLVQAPKSPPRLGTVTVEVAGGGVILALRGRVTDEPVPGATVTVSVGGVDFTAIADENGVYTIDIAALDGDAFVSIHATGTSPSGARVDFFSLVGAIARLDDEAGGDGLLTMDENGQVDATHLSTAQYVLLAEANGGTPPGTDGALQQLVQNIDIDELVEIAAVIKLVVDLGQPLPDGVDSVFDIVSDPDAYAMFVDALPEGDLQDAIALVAADSTDIAGFAPAPMPTGYAAIFPGAPGTLRVGIGGQFLLELDGVDGTATSGTGTIIDWRFRDDPGVTWTLAGDQLQVRYDQTDTISSSTFTPACSWDFTQVLTGFDVTRLQDGSAVDYLHVASVGTVDTTDHDPDAPCAPADGPIDDPGFTMLGFENGAGERPYDPAESLGTMMLSHYRPELFPNSPNATPWGAALFDFGTSTVSIDGVDPAFAWSVTGGRLHVALTDPVNGVRAHEYRRYQSDGRKGEGVMAIATDALGRRAAAYNLAVRVDGSLPAFTLAMLPGRWRSGFDISQFPGDTTVFPGFFLRLHDDAARTGVFESVGIDAGGNAVTSLFPPMTWGVADSADAGPGAMEALSYEDITGFVPFCDVATVEYCFMWRRRTWTPLAIDGNRVYVLERLNYWVGAGVELVSARPNFYEQGPIPPP